MYVKFNEEFWRNVSIHLITVYGLGTGDDNDGHEPLDPATLYALARAHELGVESVNETEQKCWIGQGGWTPEYTASRLHKRLGLR